MFPCFVVDDNSYVRQTHYLRSVSVPSLLNENWKTRKHYFQNIENTLSRKSLHLIFKNITLFERSNVFRSVGDYGYSGTFGIWPLKTFLKSFLSDHQLLKMHFSSNIRHKRRLEISFMKHHHRENKIRPREKVTEWGIYIWYSSLKQGMENRIIRSEIGLGC